MEDFVKRKKKTREALDKMTWREREKKTEELVEPFGLSFDKRRNILCEIPDNGVALLYGDVEYEMIPFFMRIAGGNSNCKKGSTGWHREVRLR